MKFDQDLCLNLQSDFGKMNSTLGSVVPLAMFDENSPNFKVTQTHVTRGPETKEDLSFWDREELARVYSEITGVNT